MYKGYQEIYAEPLLKLNVNLNITNDNYQTPYMRHLENINNYAHQVNFHDKMI